ncbi:MAG: NADH-quinone oxidoreductase subunit M [Bacteroidia bacterium]|nr:NADH-quinone oxidoreductase subunit M [Bacteroidia bacterium]MDW8302400.1 NADH-quinone oxidoreductase subunit M [Bacteroidia bacterium]
MISLNVLIFLPLLSIILVALSPERLAKVITLIVSLAAFFLSVFLYTKIDVGNPDFQLISRYFWLGYYDSTIQQWVSYVDVKYIVGIDGVSGLLIMLTTLLFPLSVLFSWQRNYHNSKLYFSLLLFLETALLGVFCALDVLLFYIFFEATLIPVFFLIGIWGGKDRYKASVKYLVYNLFGSLLMLVAILYLGYVGGDMVNGGVFTTDYMKLRNARIGLSVQQWLFIGFALSFAIKSPLFPFHTWIADTYANTTVGAMLVALLIKIGIYGFIRYTLPLLPDACVYYAPVMSVLATCGVIYGAIIAMKQPDMKRLLAYSSVSHIGFIVLGIFSINEEALSGSVLQLINYSISTGALFLCVGMLALRNDERSVLVFDYQGVAKVMPVYTFFFVLSALSSIGLPGLNSFVGEFLILLGSYSSTVVNVKPYIIVSTMGVIFAAVYMLYMLKKVLFGNLESERVKNLEDITLRERLVLAPLAILMIAIGLYTSIFLRSIQPVADNIVQKVKESQKEMVESYSLQVTSY